MNNFCYIHIWSFRAPKMESSGNAAGPVLEWKLQWWELVLSGRRWVSFIKHFFLIKTYQCGQSLCHHNRGQSVRMGRRWDLMHNTDILHLWAHEVQIPSVALETVCHQQFVRQFPLMIHFEAVTELFVMSHDCHQQSSISSVSCKERRWNSNGHGLIIDVCWKREF